MLAPPLAFPAVSPCAYKLPAEEPTFDARRHLELSKPKQVWRLQDLGYSTDEAINCASQVAIAGPFSLLSAEGVAATRTIALALRNQSQTSDRTANYLAGGVHRSKFLRDLCNAPEVADFLSELAECQLLAHSMPSQQAYINYAPEKPGQDVDTWHTDGIGFDYVVLLSDPATFVGGEFQFFRGTRREAADLLATPVERLTEAVHTDLPPDRVISMRFPAAGFAIFQQGTHVVHRATALASPAERITMVPGLVARDVRFPDPTKDVVALWGEPGIVAEYARHKAWLTRTKLDHLIDDLDPETPIDELSRRLKDAVSDVENALSITRSLMERTRGC